MSVESLAEAGERLRELVRQNRDELQLLLSLSDGGTRQKCLSWGVRSN